MEIFDQDQSKAARVIGRLLNNFAIVEPEKQGCLDRARCREAMRLVGSMPEEHSLAIFVQV